MKDLVKLVSSGRAFFSNNTNMKITFKEMADLQDKCDEFLQLLRARAISNDVGISLDGIVLTDQFIEVLAFSYCEEMGKQAEALCEVGMVEENFIYMKRDSATYEDYIAKLNVLSNRIKELVKWLEGGKLDLVKLLGYLPVIEQRYNNVLNIMNNEQLYSTQIRRKTASVLEKRILGHTEVEQSIKQAQQLVEVVAKAYVQVLAKIENEKEISAEIRKISKNEKRAVLFERKK